MFLLFSAAAARASCVAWADCCEVGVCWADGCERGPADGVERERLSFIDLENESERSRGPWPESGPDLMSIPDEDCGGTA